MIPKGVRSKDMIGMEVRTTRAIGNGAGFCIPEGTIVKIVSLGKGFTVKTENCPHCGVSVEIRGVTRNEVELISKTDKKSTNADRIRMMTDEELRDLLDCAENAGYYDSSIAPKTPKDSRNNYMDMLEWLTSEYDAEKPLPGEKTF